MRISLSSDINNKKSISFKELIGRLGLHIASQMLMTISAGLMSLKVDDWKAITVFVCLILGNAISIMTAFIDKSSSLYSASEGEAPEEVSSSSPVVNSEQNKL